MNNTQQFCRTKAIQRVACPGLERFFDEYLHGQGQPVILIDAMKNWPAMSKWSFEFFRSRYGSESVMPKTWLGPDCLKLMKLADFLDYLDDPAKPARGFWLDAKTMRPCGQPAGDAPTPLYLAWKCFWQHPELLDDIELSPKFVEDWRGLLPEAFRKMLDVHTKYYSGGLLIGPTDCQVGLHYDFLNAHSYLAQIAGRKRCVLFGPNDSAAVYQGEVDVDNPDFDRHPLFRTATAYECILEPGELLFMPYHWWHHVVGLEKSITVNYNFFNRANFANHMEFLLQIMPTIVNGLAQAPEDAPH